MRIDSCNSEEYQRRAFNRDLNAPHPRFFQFKVRRSKKAFIFLLSAFLVLSLVAGVYAASLYSYVETKDTWGENGLTVIVIYPQILDLGIRIDGSYLLLL